MEADLEALLVSNAVPGPIIDMLKAEGCFSIRLFSKWAPTRSDVQTLVLDKVQSHKTSVLAMASLLQASDEAAALTLATVKRGVEGVNPETVDEPLMTAVQEQLEKAFCTRYAWELEPRYQPANNMLGRIRREFDRRAPTVYSVLKTKSVYSANRSVDPKKRTLGEGLTVIFDDDSEQYADGSTTTRLQHVFGKFELLSTAWAICGNFEVHYDGKQTLFCHWQESRNYIRSLRERSEHLLDSCT